MATTATFVRASEHRMFFALSYDGAGPNAVTITNAELAAAAAGHHLLEEMVGTAVADDLAATMLLAAGLPGVCRVYGKEYRWGLAFEEDGGNLAQVVVTTSLAADDAILEIHRLHSIND
jgi:hypothetical protein